MLRAVWKASKIKERGYNYCYIALNLVSLILKNKFSLVISGFNNVSISRLLSVEQFGVLSVSLLNQIRVDETLH